MPPNSPAPYCTRAPAPRDAPFPRAGGLGGCVLNLGLRNKVKETWVEKQNWKARVVAPRMPFHTTQKGCEGASIPLPLTTCGGKGDETKGWIKINGFLPLDVVKVGWGFRLRTKYRLCKYEHLSQQVSEKPIACAKLAWAPRKSPVNQGDALGGRWVAVQLMEYQQPVHRVRHGAREKGCLQRVVTRHREKVLLHHPVCGAFYAELKRKKGRKISAHFQHRGL